MIKGHWVQMNGWGTAVVVTETIAPVRGCGRYPVIYVTGKYRQGRAECTWMDSKRIRKYFPRRATARNAAYKSSWSSNIAEAGYASAVQRNISIVSIWATEIKKAIESASQRRENSTFNKSLWCFSIIRQEKRRRSSNVHRLSCTQFTNNSKSLRFV